jgi:TolB-like protein/class 3 adenylate cyclase
MAGVPTQKAEVAAAQLAHRLLTILAADVVDYSRLTEAAEEETHVRLRALRVATIDPSIVLYRGQVVKNTGDGFLAAFDSSLDALRCSLEIQREVTANQSSITPDRKIRLRMALNVGDVITEPEDIYGTSVNVAARLEQYAPPGGIVISEALLDLAKSSFNVPLDDLGKLRLKNLSQPVHAYSLHLPGADHEYTAPTRRGTAGQARLPSIAVLPFRTSGGDPDDAYFGEGMVDDIIIALASIRGLMVISRTSALAYRTGAIDFQKVGQELGVRYVLSGRVRRDQSRLRIGAELTDIETGSVIWADRYDGDLSELFDLQDRIAERIVWSLAPHVREAELRRARRKRPANLNAYDLVMQAIDLLYRMNYDDFVRAGSLLRQAIAADDGYATAYAYAALWLVHNINQGWTSNHEADCEEALRLAAAAIERDHADGFALAIYGHAVSQLRRDYKTGMEIFERSLAAAPGNAMAWTLSSGVYSYAGEGRSAIERAERGLRLSPIDTQSFFYLLFLGLAHYVNSTFEESIIWARKSMSLNPRLCSNHRWLIGSLVATGRLDEARCVGQILLDVQPRFRLSSYSKWCPLQPGLRAQLLERLHAAGLPE